MEAGRSPSNASAATLKTIFKSDSFETDSTIPTQRIVLGAGIRF